MESPQKIHDTIKRLLDKRDKDALTSQYDVAVCINSVAAARHGFEAVPVRGTAEQYAQDVLAVLSKLTDEFYDSDGAYTSKGLIGDIYSDVYQYIKAQIPDEHAHIDKKEARRVLIQEMAQLVDTLQAPMQVLEQTDIKFQAGVDGGTQYFLNISFERTSKRDIVMLGNIYENETARSAIMQETLFLIDDDFDDEA